MMTTMMMMKWRGGGEYDDDGDDNDDDKNDILVKLDVPVLLNVGAFWASDCVILDKENRDRRFGVSWKKKFILPMG